MSLYSLFNQGKREANFLLRLPDVNLDISKKNFVFSSCSIWNKLVGNILEKNSLTCLHSQNYVIIRGSSKNSDLCATIPFVKRKLKAFLLDQQSSGGVIEWVPENVS